VNIVNKIADKNARILLPGAGNAWEGEYIWQQGFRNLVIVDFAQPALNAFAKRVTDFPKNQLVCDDFFNHAGQYDYILEQTFFCAIHPSLRTKYVEHMWTLLAPGGVLTGVLFDDVLNDDRPPFGGNSFEYLKHFRPIFNQLSLTKCVNSIPERAGRELLLRAVKD
jgi:SAM-dependent methyltransferase